MSPCRRDLQRPLGVRLPLHFGEVDVVLGALGEQLGDIHRRARELGFAVQEIGDLREARRAEHADPRDHARLRQIFDRKHQRLQPRGPRRQRHRQGAAHRTHRPFQAQLAQHRHAAEPLPGDLIGGGQDAQGDRQIERRSLLPYIRRGQVHGDPLEGKGVPRIGESRVHALPALFHRSLRQPDRRERRQAVGDVGLDVHQVGIDSQDGRRADARKHADTMRAGGGIAVPIRCGTAPYASRGSRFQPRCGGPDRSRTGRRSPRPGGSSDIPTVLCVM